jgi:acyl-coenzyme A thioesterase PaaI-like protein
MASAEGRIAHHDLCFGCGLANPFGLQLELRAADGGELRGRFFVKQDHQGPPGVAHGGVLASALDEAMSLAVHREALAYTAGLEVELRAPAPVGAYVEVAARVERREGRKRWAAGELRGDDAQLIAAGRALYVEPADPANVPEHPS